MRTKGLSGLLPCICLNRGNSHIGLIEEGVDGFGKLSALKKNLNTFFLQFVDSLEKTKVEQSELETGEPGASRAHCGPGEGEGETKPFTTGPGQGQGAVTSPYFSFPFSRPTNLIIY